MCGEGRGREGRAAALCAAATIIRPECYCALSAIGVGVLVTRRSVRPAIAFGVGAAAVLLPYWGLNLATAGTWDPLVVVKTAQKEASSSFAMFLFGEWGRIKPWKLAAPFVLALSAAFIPGRLRTYWVWAVAAEALVIGWLVQRSSPARILSGLFTVTPLLFLGLVHARARVVWIFAVGMMAQVVILHRGGLGGGLQLGARMFLPVVPALCALVARELSDRRDWPLFAGAAALAVLSLRGQVIGTRQGVAIAKQAEMATDHIATMQGSVVVTSAFWHGPVLSPALNQGKDVLIVPAHQRQRLIARLAERGDRAFVYLGWDPLPVNAQTVSSFTTPGGLLTIQGAEIGYPSRRDEP